MTSGDYRTLKHDWLIPGSLKSMESGLDFPPG